jgi:hypothetical protein
MFVEGFISHQLCPSTVIGMRRSLLSSSPLSMSTAQPRPSIGLFKASLFILNMLTLSDPGLQDCVHNVVHTEIRDMTCPISYLCCTLLTCEVELDDTEGSYSSCTRVRLQG